jgi:endonuclease/exonuclease/phosphatase family metal-dependent hydrolase
MALSLLSYNLLYNKAKDNIDKLLTAHRPDILCLQEISTLELNLKSIERFGYRLADYSNSFIKRGDILGVATFFKPSKFTFDNSLSFDLPRSFYEFVRFVINTNHGKRTVLKTEFRYKKSSKRITVYNLHLPPFATNNIRDRQIRSTFEDLELSKKKPVIIAGDFNYPYGRRKFELMIKKHGLSEATNNVYFTMETNFLRVFPVRLKLDYILYKNIRLKTTNKIPLRHSDHYPILSTFDF